MFQSSPFSPFKRLRAGSAAPLDGADRELQGITPVDACWDTLCDFDSPFYGLDHAGPHTCSSSPRANLKDISPTGVSFIDESDMFRSITPQPQRHRAEGSLCSPSPSPSSSPNPFHLHGQLITVLKCDEEVVVPDVLSWLQALQASGLFLPAELAALQCLPDALTDEVLETMAAFCAAGKKDTALLKLLLPKGMASARKSFWETAFWATVTVVLYHHPQSPAAFNDERFSAAYPTLLGECSVTLERARLLQYASVLRVALQVIPGKNNKSLLHRIGVYLERSGIKHITGGSLAKTTRMRLTILQAEGGARRL